LYGPGDPLVNAYFCALGADIVLDLLWGESAVSGGDLDTGELLLSGQLVDRFGGKAKDRGNCHGRKEPPNIG